MSKFKKKKDGGLPAISTASLPDIVFITLYKTIIPFIAWELTVYSKELSYVFDKAYKMFDNQNIICMFHTKNVDDMSTIIILYEKGPLTIRVDKKHPQLEKNDEDDEFSKFVIPNGLLKGVDTFNDKKINVLVVDPEKIPFREVLMTRA